MEVQFEPALQAKLDKIARESGLDAVQLVQDAVASYVDELAGTREMLDSRYDDIKSGKVKLIPGDEVEGHFREKSAAARRTDRPGS
jgi:predicted transcriptional regulator